MSPPDPLVTTRLALQAVAEHVLAAALHAATGHIGLRVAPGGFATPPFEVDGRARRLRVDGTELVVTDGDEERRHPLTTVGAAAAAAGVAPGAPRDVYEPSTPLEPDAELALDPDAGRRIAAFLAAGDDALERLRAAHPDEDPAAVQLWPEHFDLATTMAEVNYGASPGDAEHPLPYLYVGPWSVPEDGDPFWNEPFGASTTPPEVPDPSEGLAFFEEGHRRLHR